MGVLALLGSARESVHMSLQTSGSHVVPDQRQSVSTPSQRRRVLVLGGVLFLAACPSDSEPGRTPSATPPDAAVSGPLVPDRGILLGAWVKPQRGWLEHQQQAAVRQFEQQIGRRLDIYHFFVPMGRPLGWNVAWAVSTGRIPLISWHGLNSRDVLEGRHDGYIRRFAASLKRIRSPMFIRYGWEMDGTANRSWVVSPEDFVASWRYIHDLFKGVRAVWVWAPNAGAFEGKRGGADAYYPGDAYVDWIAADGFNWSACKGALWEEFSDLFGAFYRWGSSRDKPLMVPATGSVEDPANPGRKAAWFDNAVQAMDSMPRIKALVYFHSDRDCPWWADTSSSALRAFKRLARDAVG
jgi:hypothetical protein